MSDFVGDLKGNLVVDIDGNPIIYKDQYKFINNQLVDQNGNKKLNQYG